ncbi:hypothetical protein H6F43_12235 [Leptolyngbya sp. FACHB-36]|uniref:tetratricopeptide repeat protein n=1 Tax=Leptolyngbya sp. FACHB-36 TaxID=2692808 RepID=UPI0016818A88|nr:hypothetical protein [Leptolyngbya sp. FACHB-36]MBD2020947.1 hypothetical protein [Leptolyngbya sp. FACHB-36]
MRDRSIIASLLGLLITTTLPIFPQEQVFAQSCQPQFIYDQYRRIPYPIQPLPDEIATNSVSRQLAVLTEIAASNTIESNVQISLDQWLIGRPGASRPDAPTPPQMALLLKELSLKPQSGETAQLLQIFDRLAAQIERLDDPQVKVGLMSGLARFYQQLGSSDRATTTLTRAIEFSLKQLNPRIGVSNLGRVLTTALELKQAPKIAPLLNSVESSIESLIQPAGPNENATVFQVTIPLTLAQVYVETQQPEKALRLVDRAAKFAPPNQQNPDLARLYLQLNQADKAKPYLNAILKGYIPVEDPRYAVLVATYDTLKHPLSQQLFNAAWESAKNPIPESRGDFVSRYLEAGGNLDRVAQALRSSPPEMRVDYLLTVAGAYRQRNQPQQSTQAIEQFVQAVQQLQNYQDGSSAITQAIEQAYVPEASLAFQRLARLSVIAANPYTTIYLAQATNSLEAIEPTIQRLSKTKPALRTDLLQQLAIAYAQRQNVDKAMTLAAQIPLQDSDPTRSPQIETLAQVAAVLYQAGQVAPAQTVFAKAINSAQGISAPHIRATAYGAIARAYTKTGQGEAAETARQNAVKWAKAIRADPNTGIATNYVLSLVSQQFLNHTQVEAAWKTLQEISKDAYKETNIDNLIVSAMMSGQLNIAQQASELIAAYQTPEAFYQIAPSIAQAYLNRNRPVEAIALLDRATKVLNSQKKRSINTLAELIRLYARAGRIDAAQQLLATYPTSGQTGMDQRRQELQQYVSCYARRVSLQAPGQSAVISSPLWLRSPSTQTL